MGLYVNQTSGNYLILRGIWQIFGVPVKCETKQKRNGTKRNRSKRNETNRNETKQIETKQIERKRNKSKRNETNNMASHWGQKILFFYIRNSFLILESHFLIFGKFIF